MARRLEYAIEENYAFLWFIFSKILLVTLLFLEI
jgi:hypothetical protein